MTCNMLCAANLPESIKLDVLTNFPANWDLTPEAFEKHFNSQHEGLFRWLTKDHSRAKLSRKLYSDREIKLTAVPQESIT